MTDQRAVEVLRERFVEADRARRRRMKNLGWKCIAFAGLVAVCWWLIAGLARAIDMGQW